MCKTNQNPKLLEGLVRQAIFAADNFGLIDVGVSNDIDPSWLKFIPHLKVWGFDMLENEIARLRSIQRPYPAVFVAAKVGCHKFDALVEGHLRANNLKTHFNDDPGSRLSTFKAIDLMRYDYVAKHFAPEGEKKISDQIVELDDFFKNNESEINFLKIDTDGSDMAVLLGAENLLSSGSLLGVSVEIILQGPLHPYATTFGNIDSVLRRHGFSLFDFEAWRYSRSHLPAPFWSDYPSQTQRGQQWWGDGLYFRDICVPDYENMWNMSFRPLEMLKLAALYEMHNLQDCAAEVLVTFRDRLKDVIDCSEALNLLTQEVTDNGMTYDKYLAEFHSDPTLFYPSKRKWLERNQNKQSEGQSTGSGPEEVQFNNDSPSRRVGISRQLARRIRNLISKLTRSTSVR